MMQYTDNYGFKKPEASDLYNVDDFNYNAEKIDSELKSHAEHISEVSTTVEDLATKVGSGELQTTEKKIIPAINEVAAVAKGKNRARVFATTESMNAWLSDSGNSGVAIVGDNLYIVDVGVPDWWIEEVLEEPDADGRYYKIAQLETQKVDLTTYDKRIQQNEEDISALNSDLANRGLIRIDGVTGSTVVDLSAYTGKLCMANVVVDGNGFLGIPILFRIDTGASFAVNGAGNNITTRVNMNGGKISIDEAYWGTEDKISTSIMYPYILNF